MKTLSFDALVGCHAILRAVGDNKFILGSVIFEVIEDPNDGYRSMLKEVNIVEDPAMYNRSVVNESITIEKEKEVFYLNGKYGTILKFGTDYTDTRYPMFVFDYNPAKMSVNTETAVAEHLKKEILK
jgi:hypothetical protein